MDTERAVCESFQEAAQLVGRRWVPQIVWVLLDGPRRYSVLRAAIPEISDTVLSDRLRELEAAGILTRAVTPSTPVLIEYALSERGRDLAKVIDGLANGPTAGPLPTRPSLDRIDRVRSGNERLRRLRWTGEAPLSGLDLDARRTCIPDS